MIDKLTLKKTLGAVLGGSGFTRKGSTWFATSADVVTVVNLQKSDHGNYYYLRCGLHLRSLSEEWQPKINKCHIQFALEAFIPERADLFAKGLDLEAGDEDDLDALATLIAERCVPVLAELSTMDGLRRRYQQGALARSLIVWQARELLEAAA